MSSCICEFCLTVVQHKRNLSQHQKSKKCIDGCVKLLLNTTNENKELKTKLSDLNKILEEKDKIIKDLIKWKDDQFDKILTNAIKTNKSIINNNTINNNTYNIIPTKNINLSDEKIQSTFENKFELRHIKNGGVKGIARFAHKNFMINEDNEPLVVCTDINRQNFQYRENDELKYDPKMRKLTEKIVKNGKDTIKSILEDLKPTFDKRPDPSDVEEYEQYDSELEKIRKTKDDVYTLFERNEHPIYLKELSKKTYLSSNDIINRNHNYEIVFEDEKKN